MSIDNLLKELQKDLGDRAFLASEAPSVRVISTGITSLDVATGIGGFPRGTLVEVFGRESSGKTALAVYAMAEVHRNKGYTGLVNLESNITEEGWKQWAVSIAPPWFDPARVLVTNPDPGTESLITFSKMIASGSMDLVVYDSIGAMSTDKELQIGESKQAFGQSAMVTQLIKQAAHFAYEAQCVPIFLNQIRDDSAGRFVIEKAPGGHAKDHFATLRIHLKTTTQNWKKIKIDDEDEFPGFRVTARIVKNKVGSPRRRAGWNYWNYLSPDGVIGIDTFQDTIDVALRQDVFKSSGSWYYHEAFPDGKLQGGQKVIDFLRNDPDLTKKVRQQLVLNAYNDGNIMAEEESREVLTDGVI